MDRFDCISLSKEESEDTKGKSEYVNRGTDNTMVKRKRTKGATLLVGERPALQVSMMFEKKPVPKHCKSLFVLLSFFF
jgi:hypothetical protein